MNWFLMTLAQAATQPTQEAPGWAKLLASPFLLPILALFLFMMFTSKTKRRQENERTKMLENLKKNDKIQTIGGEIGVVVEVRDDRVHVKVDESSNTKIWYSRNAIHRVVTDDKIEAK